jgi:hypothetical protein
MLSVLVQRIQYAGCQFPQAAATPKPGLISLRGHQPRWRSAAIAAESFATLKV